MNRGIWAVAAVGIGLWYAGLVDPVPAGAPARQNHAAIKDGEWPVYGRDWAGSRYTPLSQLDARNIGQLKLAWTWDSPDNAIAKLDKEHKPGPNEATPIMIDGVLYTSTGLSQV